MREYIDKPDRPLTTREIWGGPAISSSKPRAPEPQDVGRPADPLTVDEIMGALRITTLIEKRRKP